MSFIFNFAKGRGIELCDRVKNADPATSGIVLIPIEAAGLESDAVLIDADNVAAVLAGATNEQTTMGRKVLVAADLPAIPSPDDAADRNDRSLPTVTWVAAGGNPIAKMLTAYSANTGTDTDADLVPLTLFDLSHSPNGQSFRIVGGVFYRAKEPT
jgi:hypothetical protein